MSFRITERVIQENIDYLEESYILGKEVKLNSGTYYDVDNYNKIVDAINNIYSLGFIDYEVGELQDNNNSLDYKIKSNTVRLDGTTYRAFINTINFIRRECKSVALCINKNLPEQSENSLTIKLPTYVKLNDLNDGLSSIKKVLGLALPNKSEESIIVQNFDSGSFWLEVGLVSSSSLAFIGALVKLSTNIFLKVQQAKLAQKHVEEAIADSDIRQSVKKELSEKLINDLRSDSEQFLTENGEENPSEERITEISKSIELLCSLMDLGTIFSPSYKALNEVKEEFPNIEMIKDLPTTSKVTNLMPQKNIENKE